jgi:hypothetical protein
VGCAAAALRWELRYGIVVLEVWDDGWIKCQDWVGVDNLERHGRFMYGTRDQASKCAGELGGEPGGNRITLCGVESKIDRRKMVLV